MNSNTIRPLPVPVNDALSKPFWEGTRKHELRMPICNSCSGIFFYPRERCPECLSDDLDWSTVSGLGRLHTYTIIEQSVHPYFLKDIPYVYAMIQLNEGPRIISNIINCPLTEIKIDMEVRAVYEDLNDDTTLINFEPAQS